VTIARFMFDMSRETQRWENLPRSLNRCTEAQFISSLQLVSQVGRELVLVEECSVKRSDVLDKEFLHGKSVTGAGIKRTLRPRAVAITYLVLGKVFQGGMITRHDS
jgi:hypothetical protein